MSVPVPDYMRFTGKNPSGRVLNVNNINLTSKIVCFDPFQNTDDDSNVQFDNLYLGMKGIIHPCTHPVDKPAPRYEGKMMVGILECIDRLMNIFRPQQVLNMAIDGLAPLAKMNQQRSLRFQASKEASTRSWTTFGSIAPSPIKHYVLCGADAKLIMLGSLYR